MEADGDKAHKGHKKRVSGMKAKKKRDKNGKAERHNPKAFTFSGGKHSVAKRVRYTLEKQAKKEHIPKVDKNPDVPPPFVVVVQGPPGVGKTTLVHSLVRHWARQKLINMRGPVTLVSGRQRRITIVECTQDVSTMLDLAKIADLVLCMIDASYGFELETFEFINMMQVHGFPRIIGVLTHLDGFKDNKQQRKVKKTLKHRFWSEVFDGAKLFYFSGLQYGRYHNLEVQNLARFISVQKCPILSWRQSHPYVLGLRWEDHTDPTLPATHPRRLDLYGYVYGGRFREGMQAHVAGMGDFHIAAIKRLPDPCPPPMDTEKARTQAKNDAGIAAGKVKQRSNALRTLADRHRVIYAPGSDIGSISVDSEAMYIQLAEHEIGFTKKDGEAEKDESELPEAVRMVRALQSGKASLDRLQASQPSLRLTRNSSVTLSKDEPETRERRPAPEDLNAAVDIDGLPKEKKGGDDDDDDDDDSDDDMEGEEEEDGESEDEEDGKDIKTRASQRFANRLKLEEAIYGRPDGKSSKAKTTSLLGAGEDVDGPTDHKTVQLFDDDDDEENENEENDKLGDGDDGEEGEGTKFNLKAANAKKRSKFNTTLLGNLGDLVGTDSIRMNVLPNEREEWTEDRKAALKARKFVTGGWSSGEEDEDGEPKKKKSEGDENEEGEEGAKEGGEEVSGGSTGSTALAKKAALDPDEVFNDGFGIACFVRIRLEDVPAACVAELRRDRMVILGALLPGEAQMGLVQVRVKRHRWHPKLLKSGDPLLLSVGWRRYQTLPIFSLEDRGEKRMRYLKYTLEHAHCTMTMYGPMVPPNAGVMAFRTFKKVATFRVAATGGVLESAPNFNIVKKLKLVGEPYKIFKNTAFIKNMFNSDLEVSKYVHAKIQTVSGIRGEIKKAEGTKGCFRATFEDRILRSDLVICKCWIKVQPKEFFNPVVDVSRWRAAKLIGELRAERGVAVPDKKDSHYQKKLVRPTRKFNQVQIPKKLRMSLPFSANRSAVAPTLKTDLDKKAAVVLSDRERQVNSLMNRLYTVRKEKKRIRDETATKKKAIKEKRDEFIQQKREVVKKAEKKEHYMKKGKEETRKRKAMNME
mmetsp:Transcript_85966/g.179761  ORF Transcript_85966/g.179761 Transcript_85966/m.179761 type:complete len:1088 (-) Transcript_85966:52-3315(-)|eukprot:CAMPEP_0206545094 /NCGR_PEP_ID=MMETSP0325_2-20121206/11932_1 /ASSEMBLY_ACC=CAM_ASM_000347 /TAXON_ID=2866 /ORGANISM="Crypthecodinium cohnii, Strain Seligo" /LENGTH=1087 /DNA_ID=CAMNT_0054044015 /DNA_START=12 /DNA_END=3275 /DNA_ORIENTATION=+